MTRFLLLRFTIRFVHYSYIILSAIRLYLQVGLQVYAKRPQDTKEAQTMALLSYRAVLGIPVTLR